MFSLTLLTGLALVVTSYALPFDALDINHINPLLIVICQPLPPPVNGRVFCEYSQVNMTCTATCDHGFVTNMAQMNEMKICTYSAPYTSGFGPCRRMVVHPVTSAPVTAAPVVTRPPGHVGICINSLADCLARPIGDYPACNSCINFVSCSNNGAVLRDCPNNLAFDDITKRCEVRSNTCL